MSTRCVITGSGALCGSGYAPDTILDAIVEGRSAIAPIRQWDVTRWPRRYAAEIADLDPQKLLGERKILKLIRRTDVFGLYAAARAIDAAGFAAHRQTLDEAANVAFAESTAVYVGSGGGLYSSQYDFLPLIDAAKGSEFEFGRQLAETVSPMWLLTSLPNNVLCHVGIRHDLKGPNGCITHHGTGSALALIEGAWALREGDAERVVAVGHDTLIEPQGVLFYHSAGVLAREAIRPFDAARDGSLLGEGAGALALETEAAAQARGAPVLGEYLGGGAASEGEGLLAIRDDGDGVERAIRLALADAGLASGDVGMIVAHGNGTEQSDASEARALERVFGSRMPPVTAFKWATGHLLAAAGIVDVALALEALKRDVVPGIATLDTLDPALPPIAASRSAQRPRSSVALVVCRGFGGANAAVLVRGAPGR
jgi:3-oxoacyl-[acyl-carrier-protein] synthase-1